MRPLLIDTDPGVDDAFAIALAALDTHTDLLAVTSVFGNVGLQATTSNAKRLLALCGRHDVPVAAGAARPLVHPQPPRSRNVHGADGLSGRAHALPPATRQTSDVSAVETMATLLRESDDPVTIACIGPLTNIALLVAVYPMLREKIERLVVMGGAITGGNVTAAAEFNIFSDPEAACRVLAEEDVPVTLVPLDLTHQCAVDGAWLDRLAEGGDVGAALSALTPDYRAFTRAALGMDGIVLHDAIAVAEALRPGLLHTAPMPVDVDCTHGPSRGATVLDDMRSTLHETDQPTRRSIDVAVSADIDAVLGFIHTGLSDRA